MLGSRVMYFLSKEGFRIFSVVLQTLSIMHRVIWSWVSLYQYHHIVGLVLLMSQSPIPSPLLLALVFVLCFSLALWSYFKGLLSSQPLFWNPQMSPEAKQFQTWNSLGFSLIPNTGSVFLIFLFVLSRWVDLFSLPEEAPSDSFCSFLDVVNIRILNVWKYLVWLKLELYLQNHFPWVFRYQLIIFLLSHLVSFCFAWIQGLAI